ncbi:hypothetical protein ABZX95_44955 [Streptomyces sp. NPDC004232]|uniref:hypothetical protein n=1 Tax=Streptomyces sp. NPDC004232 TaxID=3154454 RepID=UPI0033B349B8
MTGLMDQSALGERVGREWLGPLAATDYGGPLTSWMGAVIRIRRGAGGLSGYAMAGQLRVLGKEKKAPGSGTKWRARRCPPNSGRSPATSTLYGAP